MADSLYLSLWFPSFDEEEMMSRTAAVMRQLPFSPDNSGITYTTVQPINWSEPTILERRFTPPVTPEEAVESVEELVHDDYAVTFEAYWDLWMPEADGRWAQRPSKVRFVAHGKQFEESVYTDDGHVMVDFGLDFPFLYEDAEIDNATIQRVKVNIGKLVDFTHKVEQNCSLTGRVLWSESDENLAQKLIARLQQVQ